MFENYTKVLLSWIQICIEEKQLDPDPQKMNADPEPWILLYCTSGEQVKGGYKVVQRVPKTLSTRSHGMENISG